MNCAKTVSAWSVPLHEIRHKDCDRDGEVEVPVEYMDPAAALEMVIFSALQAFSNIPRVSSQSSALAVPQT